MEVLRLLKPVVVLTHAARMDAERFKLAQARLYGHLRSSRTNTRPQLRAH
jgi:hypothetical protein